MCDNDKNRKSCRSGNGKAQREMQNARLERLRQETATATAGTVTGYGSVLGDWRCESGPVSYVHGKCCKYVLKYAFIHTNMANGSSRNRNSSRQNNKTSHKEIAHNPTTTKYPAKRLALRKLRGAAAEVGSK